MPVPIRGDRSAHDSLNYPDDHASDLDAGTPVQHLPQNALTGQVPVWVVDEWIPQYVSGGSGSGSGGGGGPSGIIAVVNYNEVTNQVIYSTLATEAIIQVTVEVSETWDGTGAYIKIGTDADDDYFFLQTDVDLTALAAYQKFFSFSGNNDIEVTFSAGSGASQGQIKIIIEVVQT